MATSTFERKIELTDPESVKKLLAVLAADAPKEKLSEHPFTDTERNRSEKLLKQWVERRRL